MDTGRGRESSPELTFAYMRWAKAQGAAPPPFNLASSGVAPPAAELLGLDRLPAALEPRGADMPERARRQVAALWGVAARKVMLTLGTSQALFLVCAVALRRGDRCMVETPGYEALSGVPNWFGAEVIRIPRRFESAYGLPEELPSRVRQERPRLVLLSNPHNPSGRLLAREALWPVAEACHDVGATLFVDEVYLPFLADVPARTACGLPATVIGSSLTKAFGLGALRFGWLAGVEAVVDAAIRHNDFCSVLYPTPSAQIGQAAIERIDALRERAAAIREAGLERVRAFVASRSELAWQVPDAGIVGFPRLARLDVDTFARRLRREQDTLVVPGRFFGAPQHLRLGFGAEGAQLQEGLRRLGSLLDASAGD